MARAGLTNPGGGGGAGADPTVVTELAARVGILEGGPAAPSSASTIVSASFDGPDGTVADGYHPEIGPNMVAGQGWAGNHTPNVPEPKIVGNRLVTQGGHSYLYWTLSGAATHTFFETPYQFLYDGSHPDGATSLDLTCLLRFNWGGGGNQGRTCIQIAGGASTPRLTFGDSTVGSPVYIPPSGLLRVDTDGVDVTVRINNAIVTRAVNSTPLTSMTDMSIDNSDAASGSNSVVMAFGSFLVGQVA